MIRRFLLACVCLVALTVLLWLCSLPACVLNVAGTGTSQRATSGPVEQTNLHGTPPCLE